MQRTHYRQSPSDNPRILVGPIMHQVLSFGIDVGKMPCTLIHMTSDRAREGELATVLETRRTI
jgi:hypothetical protein